jgi:hypothetical protein
MIFHHDRPRNHLAAVEKIAELPTGRKKMGIMAKTRRIGAERIRILMKRKLQYWLLPLRYSMQQIKNEAKILLFKVIFPISVAR